MDFNRPYHMTNQQLEALTEDKQRSLLIGWEPGTEVAEVPVVIVSWEHNSIKEPSVPTGWYFLGIEDEYSGEPNIGDILHDSVKASD